MNGPHSGRSVPERDWRLYRDLHDSLVERYCRHVLVEVADVIGNTNKTAHQRYVGLYRLIHRRDKELARALNDPRRSTALYQIAAARALDLVTDDEMHQFSGDTQKAVNTTNAVTYSEPQEDK